MRRLASVVMVLATAGACGRLGFEVGPRDGATDVMAEVIVDALDVTGVLGPRWLASITPYGSNFTISGTGGGMLANAFAGSGAPTVVHATDGDHTLVTARQFTRRLVQLDSAGAFLSTTTLDAAIGCFPLAATAQGSDIVLVGEARGSGTLGPCDIDTPVLTPMALRVTRDGTASLAGVLTASGSDAAAVAVAAMPDGSLVISGIQDGDLAGAGSAVLHVTGTASPWIANVGGDGVRWATALAATGFNSVLAAAGDDTCAAFELTTSGTAFGAPVTNAGSTDVLVARLDGNGVARFVRAVGSTGEDEPLAVIAEADGGCTVTFEAANDLAIDGQALPSTDGPTVIARFGADGHLNHARRLPALALLAAAGGRRYAAMTVSKPTDLGGAALYTPVMSDVVVVQVDDALGLQLISAIGGPDSQFLTQLVATAPDALGIALVSDGTTTFGDSTITTTVNFEVLASLGVGPP